MQQFAQRGSAGWMEGAPQRRLQRLPIGSTLCVALRKDSAQKLIHFPRNLLMDNSMAIANPRMQVKTTGRPCAGINRHAVGNERVLQERSSEPPDLHSCGGGREVAVEA
jgi:hypothetical protein